MLDLRNYLFIRQCALLFQLERVKDVLQRMLEFMHNVVHELEILRVRSQNSVEFQIVIPLAS